MNSLFVLACLAALANVVTLAFAKEYNRYCRLKCYDESISRWRDNIGCGRHDKLGDRCLNGTVDTFPEKDSYRKVILDLHNKYRNQIAGGNKLPNFPKAARMLSLQWDDELATLALYNAKKCLGEEDLCHITDKYNNTGQNIALYLLEKKIPTPTLKKLIEKTVAKWIKERPNTIILDKNVAIGCGAVYSKNLFFMVCNYAITPETGKQIYKEGSTPAEDCTAKNILYDNLCIKADTNREIKLLEKP